VWIDLNFHFGNHKSSLYCSTTLAGIESYALPPETLYSKGFQQIKVGCVSFKLQYKKPVIPLFKGFGAFPGIYFLIKKFC
jgi:hypothetical protein